MSSSKKKLPKLSSVRNSSPPFPIIGEPPSDFFPSKGEILNLFAVIAIAASVAFACNRVVIFFNRQPKPFCDTGEHPVSDLCEPCPDNGHCSDGQLTCLDGYKIHRRKCIEDGEIDQMAKKLSDWVEDQVCNAYAEALCDEAGKIWFEEADVMKLLDGHEPIINRVLKDETFMFVKQTVLLTLENSLEKRAIINGCLISFEAYGCTEKGKEYKCSDTVVELHKHLICRVRHWLYGHAFLMATCSTVLFGFIWFLRNLQQKRNLSARAEQLYEELPSYFVTREGVKESAEVEDVDVWFQAINEGCMLYGCTAEQSSIKKHGNQTSVCEILEDNAMMVKGTNNGGDPWMVASWLRDHLLLPRERKDAKLWKKVEELLLEDSRIDQYPKLVKGESKIVMEWQASGSLSSKMRGKRAVSKLKPGDQSLSSAYEQREAALSESSVS